MRRARGGAALVAGIVLCAASPARANFHLWQVEEVFSNADGSIQYVEFFTSSDSQNLLMDHVIRSVQTSTQLDSFTLGSDLGMTTLDHFFLVATPGFKAVSGIDPDYTFSQGQTFIHLGATNRIDLVGAFTAAFLFDPSMLPTDGVHALRFMAAAAPAVVTAEPTNFAGDQGQLVPEPDAALGAAAALGTLVRIGRRRRA